MPDTIEKLIERNSRKPKSELLRECAHLRFKEEKYGNSYCDARCPYQGEDLPVRCGGYCRYWDYQMEDGYKLICGADILIEEVMRKGYEVLGLEGVNEPFKIDSSRYYADVDWCDDCNGEKGLCANCEYSGSEKCPEDMFSAECPKRGEAWAVERITDAVNEVLAWSI